LHPCSVDENVDEVLTKTIKQFYDRKEEYIAIGEIGIDLYWDKSFLKQQQDAFSKQIDLAKEENLPIVIHCRESFDEIFEILDEKNEDSLRGIFHCFTGTEEQGRRILNYGDFKLGIGGVVTFKNSGLDEVVSKFKLEDLVLETDSPYLAPVPYRGKRNESGYLIEVAKKIADIFQKDIEEVARITTMNCKDIFKL
jgi:TatD DNase family protein